MAKFKALISAYIPSIDLFFNKDEEIVIENKDLQKSLLEKKIVTAIKPPQKKRTSAKKASTKTENKESLEEVDKND